MTAERLKIDRRIPLAAILSFAVLLFVQTLTLVFVGASWKTQTDARIATVEHSIAAFDSYMQRNDDNNAHAIDKFARLEERFASMDSKLSDIRDSLKAQQHKGEK